MGTKRLVVFLDSGDTLMDESTELHAEGELVVSADAVPGAPGAVRTLHDEGYTLALVADGLTQSFRNMFRQHGIDHCFDAWVTSEDQGVRKPHPKMFRAAFEALGLTDSDRGHVVMVGNNLARDVRGANDFGIASIHLAWTSRYPKRPAHPSEVPHYTVATAAELLLLLTELNTRLERDGVLS